MAQGSQHQHEREFGNGLTVGARHVADRNAAPPSGVEVDGVHADADLLDELQPRRCLNIAGTQRSQHMQDRIGFRKQDYELFSAIAPNGISPAQAVAHAASQFLQYGIANAMAVGIIDPLEMIDIKEEEG